MSGKTAGHITNSPLSRTTQPAHSNYPSTRMRFSTSKYVFGWEGARGGDVYVIVQIHLSTVCVRTAFVYMIELFYIQSQYEGNNNNCQEVRIKIQHIAESSHFHSLLALRRLGMLISAAK